MKFVDVLLVAALVIIFAGIIWFLIQSKKSGKKCIGCPDSGSCSGRCSSCEGKCQNTHI